MKNFYFPIESYKIIADIVHGDDFQVKLIEEFEEILKNNLIDIFCMLLKFGMKNKVFIII